MKYAKVLTAFPTLLIAAQGALGQGAAAGSVQSARVLIATKDTSGRYERAFVLQMPVIDSLVKRLNSLPVGSAEFVATDSALAAVINNLPHPPGQGATFSIEISSPRAAMRSRTDVVPQGTLGFTADGVNRVWYEPAGTYLQYFEYPTVVRIEANSPASKAGVRAGDTLMAYNGLDVRRNAVNMTQLLTPGRDVAVRLRRDGEAKDIMMTVDKASPALIADRRVDAARAAMPEAPFALEERAMVERRASTMARATAPPAPQKGIVTLRAGTELPTAPAAMMPAQRGVLGAAVTDVDPDMASSLRGMDGKVGVLVTMVPQGSLAERTGLRNGDVILRVDAYDIASVAQLRIRLYSAEANGSEKIRLSVLRAGKTQDIYYNPR